MQPEPLELEGTWEEILEHARELAGRRVHLRVVDGTPSARLCRPLSEAQRQMLEVLEELRRDPPTPEEMAILDGFEQFRKEHPFNLRQLQDLP